MEQTEKWPQRRRKPYRYAAMAAFWLAVTGALTAVLSGLGARWEWWEFGTGFALLKWAVYAGIAAILLSLVGLLPGYKTGCRQLVWAGGWPGDRPYSYADAA